MTHRLFLSALGLAILASIDQAQAACTTSQQAREFSRSAAKRTRCNDVAFVRSTPPSSCLTPPAPPVEEAPVGLLRMHARHGIEVVHPPRRVKSREIGKRPGPRRRKLLHELRIERGLACRCEAAVGRSSGHTRLRNQDRAAVYLRQLG